MSTIRYAVAKYIPDLMRMEPHNIGVVVWSPEGVDARFAAEKPDKSGDVDGRSLPPFITNPNVYRQWIRYWRAQIEKPTITPLTGGPAVPQGSEGYLDALFTANKGNYVLMDAGVLLDRVGVEDLPDLTDHLFQMLVDASGEEVRDPTLDKIVDDLIAKTRLRSDPHFRSGYKVRCRVPSRSTNKVTMEEYEFSHAYANGRIQRLYQRVPLSPRKTVLRKTIHDSAWMFRNVVEQDVIGRDQGVVLVNVSSEQMRQTQVANAIDLLDSIVRVVNVHDEKAALGEFEQLTLSLR